MQRKSYYEELNRKEREEEQRDYEQAQRIEKALRGTLAPRGVEEYLKLRKAKERLTCKRKTTTD